MIIGVPKESQAGERRVAATPDTVKRLKKLGFDVTVERDAGALAAFPNQDYEAAGARVVDTAKELWAGSDIVLKVQPPTEGEADLLESGATLVSFIWPSRSESLLKRLAGRGVTVLAMDRVPRISRAQKLDALSSMANIAGYRAVVEAAQHFGRFFTGQITAAGKVPPAKVLVIGAGVAGLAAIGAARGLGAVVRAFDTREEVKDQVRSLGATFLEVHVKEEGGGGGGYAKVMSEAFIKAEMALFAAEAKEVDIIITTALIPDKRAPILITADMVRSMKPGSVLVDLAAEQGGNIEGTKAGEVVTVSGVTIIGYTDLPSRLAAQASQLYGTNLVNLLTDMVGKGESKGAGSFKIDQNDEVIRGMTVVDLGRLAWPPPPAAKAPAPAAPAAAAQPVVHGAAAKAAGKDKGGASRAFWSIGVTVVAAGFLAWLGRVAPPEFLNHMTVFVLAALVGWQVIWNVTPALHTPLMSVTNAISGIIVIGAMFQIKEPVFGAASLLAGVAVLVATINVAGGFLVTQRMLNMFRR
jgi:NAD(P) transhydrogenase subunit alpha